MLARTPTFPVCEPESVREERVVVFIADIDRDLLQLPGQICDSFPGGL